MTTSPLRCNMPNMGGFSPSSVPGCVCPAAFAVFLDVPGERQLSLMRMKSTFADQLCVAMRTMRAIRPADFAHFFVAFPLVYQVVNLEKQIVILTWVRDKGLQNLDKLTLFGIISIIGN